MLRKMTATAASVIGLLTALYGDEPTSITGPNVRFILAPKQLTTQTCFSLMGEVGEKTARVNGTLGYQIGACQRLKLSIDQLSQKLKYNYANGSETAWVRQIAAGAAYKYLLDDYVVDSIDVGGWYSNAPNKKLTPFTITTGTTSRIFNQYVAGSEAWHGYAGTTIFPWACATIGLSAVYDHVDYRLKTGPNKTVSGAGFAVDFNQRICKCIDLNLRGEALQPYQHLGGSLNWMLPSSYGNMVVGLYGDYTRGRKGLPNDASFGVQIKLELGSSCYLSPFYATCCYRDRTRPRQDLLEWVADPAVMMPIVLAIANECTPATSVPLPDVLIDLGPYAINVSSAFSIVGRALRYSALGLPPGATIDVESGVISGTNLGLFSDPFEVTVIASCVCGSATSTFVMTYESL